MVPLGIHHLTAIELDPVDFAGLAAEAGCQSISVFTQPLPTRAGFPLVDADNRTAFAGRLRDGGLQLANVEGFMLTPETDMAAFYPALETGAHLEALGATALIYDADPERVTDNLNRFCEMTADLGLNANVEFTALSPHWNTIEKTAALVTELRQPNLGIGIDLLHLIRSGGDPSAVAATAPQLIAYAQLCDGTDLTARTDYAREAGSDRLAPGEGQFPLTSFLRSLPAGTLLEIEVPAPSPRPARERLPAVVAATRRQLRRAGLE